MVKIIEGDKVYNLSTDTTGRVETIYPEVNIAIVKVAGHSEKMRLDDLIRLKEESVDNYGEEKRAGLLDKIKGRFK